MNDDFTNTSILLANSENLNDIVNDDEPKNKYGIKLSNSQIDARYSGYKDSVLNVQHSSYSDVQFLKKAREAEYNINTESGKSDQGYIGSPSNTQYGAPNATKNKDNTFLSESLDNLDSEALWSELYGSTAYTELKHRVGLRTDESFTEYYERTNYIPRGFEKEAQLLLAEEKRMGYYKDYLDGKTSETDFLYNAYGKDLLKESGYDLESPLFWYSRHKQGDYNNPLDNDTFLAKLIADSRTLFEKEAFYETIANKDKDLMLQGMISNMSLGTKLSEEQVAQLFEPQIAQLKDYFNDDVSKILTYYKSGNLSNDFNPFIDIDDDGKFDYYYHVDGKMYACEEGSAAKGVKKNLTADVSYNEDGSVHEVEVNDGLTGFGGAFFEGLGSFATSLVDTIYTLGWGITGGYFQGYDNVDALVAYDATKNSFMANDVQVFSGKESADTAWGRGIGEVTGMVIEQVILAVTTYGAGNVAVGAAEAAAKGATKSIGKAVVKTVAKTAVKAAVGAGVGAAVGGMINGEEGAQTGALVGLGIGASLGSLGISKELAKEGLEKAAVGTSNAVTKAITNTLQMTGKIRSGIPLGKTPIAKGASIAIQQMVKDVIQTNATLRIQNKQLEILKGENPDFEFGPLSDGDIWGRSLLLAGVNGVLTFGLRAYGESTMSTRFGRASVKDSEGNKILNLDPNTLSPQGKIAVNIAAKNTFKWNLIDNVADIAENFLTAGTQAAIANPYVRDFATGFDAAISGMLNPGTILSSAYSALNNSMDLFGGSSIAHDKAAYAYKAYAEMGMETMTGLRKLYYKLNTEKVDPEGLRVVKSLIDSMDAMSKDPTKHSYEALVEMNAAFDQVFKGDNDIDVDMLVSSFGYSKEMAEEVKKVMAKLSTEHQEVGFITALTIATEQSKNRKAMMDHLQRGFNSIVEANKKYTERFKDLAFGKGIKGWFNKQLYSSIVGNAIKVLDMTADNMQHDSVKAAYGEEYAKYIKTFKDQYTSIEDLVTATVLSERLAKIETASDKEYDEMLSKLVNDYFDFSVYHNESGNATNIVLEQDAEGKLIFKAAHEDGTEYSQEELFKLNPILYLLTNDPNSEAAQTIRQAAGFPQTKEELVAFFKNNPHMFALLVNDSQHNKLQGDEQGKKLMEYLDILAALSLVKDSEGKPLFNLENPLLTKITYKGGFGKTDSGNAKEYTVYAITPFFKNSILETTNTIQTVLKTIGSFYTITNSSLESKDRIIALRKLGWLAENVDATHGVGTPDYVKDKEEEMIAKDYYYYKGLDIIFAASEVNRDEGSTKAKKPITIKQLKSLARALSITSDDLKEIISNTVKVGADGKPIHDFSDDARTIAKEYLAYDTLLTNIKKCQEKAIKLKEQLDKAKGSTKKLNLSPSERELFIKTILELRRPENETLYKTLLREEPATIKLLQLLYDEKSGGLINFLKGLEDKDHTLLTQLILDGVDDDAIDAAAKDILSRIEAEGIKSFNQDIDTIICSGLSKRIAAENREIVKQTKVLEKQQELLERYKTNGETSRIEKVSKEIAKINKRITKHQEALSSLNNSLFTVARTVGLPSSTENIKLLLTNPDSYFDALRKAAEVTFAGDKFKYDTTIESIKLLQKDFKQESLLMSLFENISGESLNNSKLIELLKSGKPGKVIPIQLFVQAVTEETNEPFDVNELANKHNVLTYKGKEVFNCFKDIIEKDINQLQGVTFSFDTNRKALSQMIVEDMKAYRDVYYSNTNVYEAKNVVEINLLELAPKAHSSLLRQVSACREALDNYYNHADDATIADLRKAIKHTIDSGTLNEQQRAYAEKLDLALQKGAVIFEIPLDSFDSSEVKPLINMLKAIGYDDRDLISMKNHDLNVPGIIYKDKTTRAVDSEIEFSKFINAYLQQSPSLTKPSEGTSINQDLPDYEYGLMSLFGINLVTEDTALNLTPDFKVITTIKAKNADGVYDIEHSDWGSFLESKFVKSGLSGGYLSKFYDLRFNTNTISGDNDPTTRNTFIAHVLADNLLEYLDSKNKGTEYQAVQLKFTVATKENKQEILDYYKKNSNSLYIPLDGAGADNELVFTYNKNFDKDSYLQSVSSEGFDLKRLVPLFTTSVVLGSSNEFNNFKAFKTTTDFWNPINIIKNAGFEELRTQEQMVTYASSVKPVYSLDNKEYSDFITEINKTKPTTIKTVLDLIESKYKDTNNYYIKTLKYSLETSLQISTNSIKKLSDNNESGLIKFSNFDTCIILGRVLNQESPDGYSGKSYGDLLSSELDEETRKQILSKALEVFKQKFKNEAAGLNTLESQIISDPNRTITGLDSVKFKSTTPIETIESIQVEDLELLLTVLNGSKSLLFKDISNSKLPEHNSVLNMMSCLSVKYGKLHIDLDYYFSKPTADRAQLLKFLSTYSSEGKKLALDLLSRENKYQRISGSFQEINNEFNLITNSNAFSKVVFEVIAPNAVTVQAQKNFTSFADLNDLSPKEFTFIENIIRNKGVSFFEADKYIKLSSLNSVDEDTLTSPILDLYQTLLNRTLVRSGDKAGASIVFNIDSRAAIAEFFIGITTATKRLEQLVVKDTNGNTIPLLSKLSKEDLIAIAMDMNLYSTGTSRQAEFAGYLYLKIDKDGKYTLTPVKSSISDSEDALITGLLFSRDGDVNAPNMYIKNIQEDTESQHLLIQLDGDMFKMDANGLDPTFKLYDLANEDTVTAFLRRGIVKARKAEHNKGLDEINRLDDFELMVKYYGRQLTVEHLYDKMVYNLETRGVSPEVSKLVRPMIQKLLSSNATSLSEEQIQQYMLTHISTLKHQPSNKELEIFTDIVVNGITKEALSSEMRDILSTSTKTLLNTTYTETQEVVNKDGTKTTKEINYSLSELIAPINIYIKATNSDEREEALNLLVNQVKTLETQIKDKKILHKIIQDSVAYLIMKRQQGKDLEFILGSDGTSLKDFYTKMVVDDSINSALNLPKAIEQVIEDGEAVFFDTEWFAHNSKSIEHNELFQIGIVLPTKGKSLTTINSLEDLVDDNYTKHVIIIKEAFEKTKGKVIGSFDSKKDSTPDAENTYRYAGAKEQIDDLEAYLNGTKDIPSHYIIVDTYDEAMKKLETLTAGRTTFIGHNNKGENVDNDMIMKYSPNFFKGKYTVDTLNDILLGIETNALVDKGLSKQSRIALQDLKTELGLPDAMGSAHDALSDVVDTINLLEHILFTKAGTTNIYKDLYNEVETIINRVSSNTSLDQLELIETLESLSFKFDELPEDMQEIANSLKVNAHKKGNAILKTSLDDWRTILEQKELRVKRKEYSQELKAFITKFITVPEFQLVLEDAHHKKVIGSVLYNMILKINPNFIGEPSNDISVEALSKLNDIVGMAIKAYFDSNEDALLIHHNAAYLNNETKMQYFFSAPTEDIKHYLLEAYNRDKNISTANPLTLEDLNKEVSLDNYKDFVDKEEKIRGFIKTPEYERDIYNFTSSFAEPVINFVKDAEDIPADIKNKIITELLNVVCWTEESRDLYNKNKSKTGIPNSYNLDLDSKLHREVLQNCLDLLEESTLDEALYFMATQSRNEFFSKQTDRIDDTVGYMEVRVSSSLYKKAYGTELSIQEKTESGYPCYYTHAWRQPMQYKNLPIVKIVIVPDSEAEAPLTMSSSTAKAINGDFDGDFYYFKPYNTSDNESLKTLWEAENIGVATLIDTMLQGTADVIDEDLDNFVKQRPLIEEAITGLENAFKAIPSLKGNTLRNAIELLENNFINLLISKGLSQEDAKSAWDIYGVKLYYTHTDKKTVIPYSTCFIYNGNEEMNKNRQLMLHNLHLQSDFDSQEIGVINKVTKGIPVKGSANEVLQHASFVFTKETARYINKVLSTDTNRETVATNLITSINKLSETLDGDHKVSATALTNYINRHKNDLSSQDIMMVVQTMQDLIYSSNSYNSKVTPIITERISNKTAEFKEKYTLIKSELSRKGITLEEETKLTSTAEMLAELSRGITELFGKETLSTIRTVRSNSSTTAISAALKNILIAAHSDEVNNIITVADRTKVIRPDDVNFSQDGNNLLTGTTIVAVPKNPTNTPEKLIITKHNKINLIQNYTESVSLLNLNPAGLVNLENHRSYKGHELNSLLNKADKPFIPDATYMILNADEVQGNITPNTKLEVVSVTSLKQAIQEGNFIKTGSPTGKNMKGTTSYDESIVFDGDILPEFIVSPDLIDPKKSSSDTKQKHLGTTKDSNGNEYELFEVGDVSIVSSQLDNVLSKGDRKMDPIAILQTSQSVGALYQHGDLFFTVDADGNLSYDANNFSRLHQALNSKVSMGTQEKNANHILNYFRLQSMLSCLEKEDLDYILPLICNKLEGTLSVEQALIQLYNTRDLGGTYGDTRIDTVYNYIRRKGLMNKVIDKIKSNAMYKTAWSEDLDIGRKHTEITSSILDTSKPQKSKHTTGTINQRSSEISNIDEVVEDEYSGLFNGIKDTNTRFTGAISFLEKLLTNIKGERAYLSRGLLGRLVESGILQPELATNGTIHNGFKPVLKSQGVEIPYDPSISEQSIDRKSGAYSRVSPSKKIRSASTLLDTPSESILTSDFFDMNYDANRLPNEFNPYMSHSLGTIGGSSLKGINLILSDWTQESMVSAITNGKQTVSGSVSRPVPVIAGNEIVLDTFDSSTTPRPLTGNDTYNDFLKKRLGSKKVVDRKIELQREDAQRAEELRANKTVNETLQQATQKYESSEDQLVNLILSIADTDDVSGLTSGLISERQKELLESVATPESMQQDIELNCNENGEELVGSFFETFGYKTKSGSGLHIPLGRVTMNMTSITETYRNKLLSTEYSKLQAIAKVQPELIKALNEWSSLKLLIDFGTKLLDDSTSKRLQKAKNGGKNSYNSLLFTLKDKLNLPSDASVEDIKLKVIELQKRQKDLTDTNKNLLQCIGLLETVIGRLNVVGNKFNPYNIIQYYIPIGATKNKSITDKLKHSEYIKKSPYRVSSNEEILKSLASMETMLTGKDLIYGQDESLGVLGNIARVADEYSKQMAIEIDLHNELVRGGWITNASVYSKANEYVKNHLTEFFETATTSTKNYEYEKAHYEVLRYKLYNLGLPEVATLKGYKDRTSLKDLIDLAQRANGDYLSRCGVDSSEQLFKKLSSATDEVEIRLLQQAVEVTKVYQDILADLCIMACEKPGNQGSDYSQKFLIDMYDYIEQEFSNQGLVLVDSKGALLEPGKSVPTYKSRDLNGMVMEMMIGQGVSTNEAKKYIAEMMLRGDVYVTKASTSEQLTKKLYTEFIPGPIVRLLRLCKNVTTTLIMSTPLQLIDRAINFTTFDYGTLAQCAPGLELYMGESIATVQKLFASEGNISETTLKNDATMQHLLRYIAASGYNPTKDALAQGEKISASNIPGIKQYLKMVNDTFGKQNLYARFAYYLMMAREAEQSNFQINFAKSGAAYVNREGINQIHGKVLADVYNFSPSRDVAQLRADMDTKIAEIIDQNLGSVNGMPYGSKILSEWGLAFTSFPLALIRWGKNSLMSIGSAFTDFNGDGKYYLANKALGTAMSYALLLALQCLISPNLQEYLFGDKEEMDEEDIEKAQNILFRGGQVQLFKTLMTGEDAVSANQSRGPVASVFDNYIAEFIPMFQDKDYDDEKEQSFFESFCNVLKTNVWSKVNPLFKDPIESIPGNTYLQSTTWYTPGDSWLENMQRKVTGYLMGSAQANSFIDSWNADSYEEDLSFMDKISNGLRRAYIEKNTNVKESKSAFKNYKNALSILYKYNQFLYADTEFTNDDVYNTSQGSGLKAELNNALKNNSSPEAIYNIIAKYKKQGTSLYTIRTALNGVSVRAKYRNVKDKGNLLEFLTEEEENILKQALMYEDTMFPFLDEITEDIQNQYYESKKSQGYYSGYTKSIGDILKTYEYNKPKIYSDYNNRYNSYNPYANNYYKNYNKNYLDNYDNYYKNNQMPDDVYKQLMNMWKYGKSTDIWGNKQTGYTNIKGDTWTWDGGK